MSIRSRSFLVGLFALIGVAAMPSGASAQCFYTPTLGIGGTFTGCMVGTATAIGEDAGYVSSLYWFNGMPSLTGPLSDPTNIFVPKLNAPSNTATPHFMFTDDCGSNGNTVFDYCTGTYTKAPANFSIGTSTPSELVFGMAVPDLSYGSGGYWEYSGSPATRNAAPAPPGFQNVVMQVVLNDGVTPVVGQYVVAFEDLNTGCIAENPAITTITLAQLANGSYLNSALHDCSAHNGNGTGNGGNSDADFNDFYIGLSLTGTSTSTVPEPVTMSLMAVGLVGLGGAQLRRRHNRKG